VAFSAVSPKQYYKPFSGGIDVQNIEYGSVYRASFALGITMFCISNSRYATYKHTMPCEIGRLCPQNVFVAGTGYLKNHSGPKNTVQLPTPSGTRHLAVLSAFVQAEGLTDAYLAVFEEAEVMPKCQVSITAPPYEYGSWRIRGVYQVSGGKRLAWLEAGGGDGGFIWSLNVFLQFTS
jgi:hypothetical protein